MHLHTNPDRGTFEYSVGLETKSEDWTSSLFGLSRRGGVSTVPPVGGSSTDGTVDTEWWNREMGVRFPS